MNRMQAKLAVARLPYMCKPLLIGSLIVALAAVLSSEPCAGLPVEAGSFGNLLEVHLDNPDSQLPLMARVIPRDVPFFIDEFQPESQLTDPGIIPPLAGGIATFRFDVDPAASPGSSGVLTLVLFRSEEDSLEILIPLDVVAPVLLDHAVDVVFRVNFGASIPPPAGAVVEAVLDGGVDTVPLADSGAPPDSAASDLVYSGSRVFGVGAGLRHRWIVTVDGIPECDTTLATDHRVFVVDPAYDATSHPHFLPVVNAAACGTVGVVSRATSVSRTILHLSPNPFVFSTSLAFRLALAGTVEVVVHDIAGRSLRRMSLGRLDSGLHVTTWEGTTAAGERLEPGIYFVRLLLDGEPEAIRRCVLLR
jgi:hypothetical protein